MPTDGHWDALREAQYAYALRGTTDTPGDAAQPPATPRDDDSLPDLIEHTESLPPTPPLDLSDQVDIILAVKLRRSPAHRRLENLYLVQWVGLGPEFATWEPVSNLWGAWEAVQEAHAYFELPPPAFHNPLD
jgi:hypothetical protein